MSSDLHDDFRHAMGSLAAGVTVVSCCVDGTDHAMTATAVSSVSLDPPLVLVCVARSARFREAIASADHWAVSILAVDAQPHAAWLATKGRPLLGQLDAVPHRRSPHGCAWLKQSVAWVECRAHSQITAGDHDIVIGEVVAAEARPADAGEDGADPLVYWRSRYWGVAD